MKQSSWDTKTSCSLIKTHPPLPLCVPPGGHRLSAAGRWSECWAAASRSDVHVCSSPTTPEHPQQMSCHILCEVCTFSLDVRFIFPSTRRIILFKVDFGSKKAHESLRGIVTTNSAARRRHTGATGATNGAAGATEVKGDVNFGTLELLGPFLSCQQLLSWCADERGCSIHKYLTSRI